MGYDASKDKTLKRIGIIGPDKRGNSIKVEIVKYGDGEPKVAIMKTFTTKDGEERATSKIGRLDWDTLLPLHELLGKAIGELDQT